MEVHLKIKKKMKSLNKAIDKRKLTRLLIKLLITKWAVIRIKSSGWSLQNIIVKANCNLIHISWIQNEAQSSSKRKVKSKMQVAVLMVPYLPFRDQVAGKTTQKRIKFRTSAKQLLPAQPAISKEPPMESSSMLLASRCHRRKTRQKWLSIQKTFWKQARRWKIFTTAIP